MIPRNYGSMTWNPRSAEGNEEAPHHGGPFINHNSGLVIPSSDTRMKGTLEGVSTSHHSIGHNSLPKSSIA